MLLGGVSLKGSKLDINQDSFITRSMNKGFAAVLSDGLGSCGYSQIGSEAICRCTAETAEKLGKELLKISPQQLVKLLHGKWLRSIQPYRPSDCSATLLLLVVYENRGIAARLGDGFIGICHDGRTDVLFDRNKDFSNDTYCLSEKLTLENFEFSAFKFSELRGGLMCSDGIENGIETGDMQEKTLKNFTRDFVMGYRNMSAKKISEDIRGWIKDWPCADDKTLAFFISERK